LKFSKIYLYWILTKPNISFLVLATTAWGFFLGITRNGYIHLESHNWVLLFHLLIGSFLSSGGVSALNEYIERQYDKLMFRTKNRPIPSGRLDKSKALIFGILTSILGIGYLFYLVNPVVSFLSFLTTIIYLFIYTPLKRVSAWSLLVGAIPGAFPPIGGWIAATGGVELPAWVLFSILFFWQIPHFLAISILYKDDYERGGFIIFPSKERSWGITNIHLIFFSFALLVASISLSLFGITGHFYILFTSIIGIYFIIVSGKTVVNHSNKQTRKLLFVSICYLPILLGITILDAYIR